MRPSRPSPPGHPAVTATKPPKRRARCTLTRDTDLIPEIIAETVCDEATRLLEPTGKLRGLILRDYTEALAAKAYRCYATDTPLNRIYRRRLRGPGHTGRDALYGFMRHWLFAFLVKDHRHLSLALPPEFAVGRRCEPRPSHRRHP